MGNEVHSNKDSPQQIHTQTDSPHNVSHDKSHEPQDNPTSQPVDSSPLSTDRSDEPASAHDNDRGQCTTTPPLQPRRSTRQRQNSLEKVTQENKRAKKVRRYIVVEALYQNSGQIAPMDEIIKLKEQYKFRVLLDESNSFGVLGSSGRGLTEHYRVPVC
nr:long chain base biosynthesis protein 1 [Ipomoea trifida]